MATAAVQHAPGHHFGQAIDSSRQIQKSQKHDVATELYYYKENADGSPPAPSYVGYGEVNQRNQFMILIR